MQPLGRGIALAIYFFCSASTLLAAPAPPTGVDPARLPSDDTFANPRRSIHRFDDFVYTGKERVAETTEKMARLRKLLTTRKVDGVVITTQRNLQWVTGGGRGSDIRTQRESSVKLLITLDRLYCIGNNVYGPRVVDEELAGLGYEWVRYPWTATEKDALQPLLRDKRILWDSAAAAQEYGAAPGSVINLTDLYFPLTPGEMKKIRWLGHKVSETVEKVGALVQSGMLDRDVQYLLERELAYWDIVPEVTLASGDDRTRTYPRPQAVGNVVKRYVGMDVYASRWGLGVELSRRIQFGEPVPEVGKAWKDTPKVNAAIVAASHAGATFGDVLEAADKAYRQAGYPDEWKLRSQGGLLISPDGQNVALPKDKTRIQAGMVLAWYPMAGGAKFEDTYLVKPDGTLENLTAPISWPTVTAKVGKENVVMAGLWIRPEPAPMEDPASN